MANIFFWKNSTILFSAFCDYLLITGKPVFFMGHENLKTVVCRGEDDDGCAGRHAVATSTCQSGARALSSPAAEAPVCTVYLFFRTPVVHSELLQLHNATYVYDANS